MYLSVDPQAYASASQTFGEFLPQAIAELERELNTALNDAAECAGHDPAGVAFAEFYDLSAGQTLQAIENLRRSAITVASLLQQSGFNHARSDAHSSVSSGVLLEDSRRYDPGFGQDVVPASIAGSGFFCHRSAGICSGRSSGRYGLMETPASWKPSAQRGPRRPADSTAYGPG